MARDQVPETGAPETIEIEATISPVSQDQKTVPEADVIICDTCAKGFLRWISNGVDIEPVWFVTNAKEHGGICGGALLMKTRSQAMEIADRFERIGAAAWLSGQRR